MSLTDDQRDAIVASWVPVRANKKTVGIALLMVLFEKFPDYRSMFKNLEHIAHEDLPNSPKMKAHALSVMSMFTSWVDHLGEVDVLVELIKKIGVSHAKRGQTKEQFHSLFGLLPGFFADNLGDIYDDRTAAAWGAAIKIIGSVLDQTFDDYAKEHQAADDSITEKDVEIMKETWSFIYKKKVQNGVDLFITLFTVHPQYKSHFKQFQDIDISDLPTNPKMKAHAATVMHALESWIDMLEEGEVLTELVKKNAKRHEKRGLSKMEFNDLWVLFPVFLEQKLGDLYTPEAQNAWRKGVKALKSITDSELDECLK